MSLVIHAAPVGLAVDLDENPSDTALDAMIVKGVQAVLLYAEILTKDIVTRVTNKKLGLGILTFSRAPSWVPSASTGAADAKRALDAIHSLGIPNGLTVWDDVEGPSPSAPFEDVIAHVDAHAEAVTAAKDIAGDYIGYGCQLTSEEWQARPNVHAYYKGGGITRDRFAKAVEPERGWQIIQRLPFNRIIGGCAVDIDSIGADQRGSYPMFVYETLVAMALGDVE